MKYLFGGVLILGEIIATKPHLELDLGVASFVQNGDILPGDHRPSMYADVDYGTDEEDMTIEVSDAGDVQIFAKMYVGSNEQPFNWLFDTGSSWLWVNSRVCGNCNPSLPKFDERQSETFKFFNVIYDLHYGSADIYGYGAHDKVCILPGECADDFSMVAVGYQNGANGIQFSGLVGMSPQSFDPKCDLFIEKMKKAGVIDSAVFSMYINLGENKSKMTLGGFNLHQYSLPGQ